MTASTRRYAVGVLIGLALLALVLLAASLPSLQFRAGQPFVVGHKDDAGSEQPAPTEAAAPQDLASAPTRISAAEVVVLVLLLASVIYLIVSHEERKRFLRRLIAMLGVLAFFLFLRQNPELLAPIRETVGLGDTAVPAEGRVVQFSASAPAWIHWAVTLGMAAALALTAVAAARLYRRRQRNQVGTLEEIATEAKVAVEALLAGADVRDTILRCYYHMSRVVSEERSLTRGKAMTPREFEERLAAAGLPGAAVRRLTRLFERVRYGAQQMGHAEEADALDCLQEVIEACRANPDPAPAVPVLHALALQGEGLSEPGRQSRTARRLTRRFDR